MNEQGELFVFMNSKSGECLYIVKRGQKLWFKFDLFMVKY